MYYGFPALKAPYARRLARLNWLVNDKSGNNAAKASCQLS
jgi:hypothetical protein